MTLISDIELDRTARNSLRRKQSHIDALSIGVAAVGSVVLGRPCDQRQWTLARLVWSPALQRFTLGCEQADDLAEIAPNVDRVLQHTLQRAHFADDLIRSIDAAAPADDDHRIMTCDALQRLASSCFVSRNVLGRFGAGLDGTASSDRDQTIDRLLKAVTAGHAPCLDPGGALVIPGWAERRQHKRTVTNDLIELRWNNVRHMTYVINRTSHGYGIVSIDGLAANMTVDVTLANGSMAEARVVWVASGRAGLQILYRGGRP